MTKADFINAVHAEMGESVGKRHIGAVLDAYGAVVRAMIGKGEDIPLAGLGSLKVVQRAARTGRNPKTGEALQIPAKRAVKFTANKALKEALE